MASKTILITGITGMVGSHLLDYVADNEDCTVVGLCRWRSPMENIQHHTDTINRQNRIRLEYGDLNDVHSLRRIFEKYKFDYISHLAAHSFPRTSFDSPSEVYNTNVTGTSNLLELAREFAPDARIHICSSSEVFGRVPKENVPINEETKFHPASPYAISKAGTDLIGRFYGEAYGLKTVVTRMFTHTGPRRGDVFAESSFAKQIAMIEKGLSVPIIYVGNLDSLRTFADVRDAVRAYWILLDKVDYLPGECFNIGGQFTCTVGEMLDHLIGLSTFDESIEVKVDPNRLRPIDADLQIPDVSKFKKVSEWSPIYSFNDTMRDLLNFWRVRIEKTGPVVNR